MTNKDRQWLAGWAEAADVLSVLLRIHGRLGTATAIRTFLCSGGPGDTRRSRGFRAGFRAAIGA